jgi:hypothetical protein
VNALWEMESGNPRQTFPKGVLIWRTVSFLLPQYVGNILAKSQKVTVYFVMFV